MTYCKMADMIHKILQNLTTVHELTPIIICTHSDHSVTMGECLNLRQVYV